MTSRREYKSNELVSIFHAHPGWNLARVKFFVLFSCAFCKVKSVGFEKLASAFDISASSESSLRRIQRFMAAYVLDTDLIARLVFKLLPYNPFYCLALDRRMLTYLQLPWCNRGIVFPLLNSLLPKLGNSNTQKRINLVDRFIDLFGIKSIDCLTADSEFVGSRWIKYLNDRQIRYYIRIQENFEAVQPRNGKCIKAQQLILNLPLNTCRVNFRIVLVNNQLCYLGGSKIKDKSGKYQLQILASFNKPECALQIYKQRWQVENSFKSNEIRRI